MILSEIVLLVTSQLIFGLSRTLNVRYVAEHKVIPALVTSTIVKLAWLGSTAIGVKSATDLIENTSDLSSWTILLIFIISGVLGDRLAFIVNLKRKDEE